MKVGANEYVGITMLLNMFYEMNFFSLLVVDSSYGLFSGIILLETDVFVCLSSVAGFVPMSVD